MIADDLLVRAEKASQSRSRSPKPSISQHGEPEQCKIYFLR
jgi:hypothetical protein